MVLWFLPWHSLSVGCDRQSCTLNGSGLATSRIFPALVEQNQNADGSINVPDALKKYLGVDVIRK